MRINHAVCTQFKQLNTLSYQTKPPDKYSGGYRWVKRLVQQQQRGNGNTFVLATSLLVAARHGTKRPTVSRTPCSDVFLLWHS